MSFVTDIKDRARETSRTVALSAFGFLCLIVGAGFLTTAAWMLLEQWQGRLFAAVVLGGLYAGVGLIVMALAGLKTSDSRKPRKTDDAEAILKMVEGFLTGLNAGRQAGGRSEPRSRGS